MQNGILLNSSKTELLNIKGNQHILFHPIYIDSNAIMPSKSMKYLDFTFDHQLNIDINISSIVKSATYNNNYNLYKIRLLINTNIAIILCNSLIRSRLSYYNALFRPTEIHKINNRSLRIIYRLRRNDYDNSITTLRRKLNWIYTADDINLKILTLLFITLTNNLPANLCKLPHIKPPNKGSSIAPFLNPKFKSERFQNRSFSASIARL